MRIALAKCKFLKVPESHPAIFHKVEESMHLLPTMRATAYVQAKEDASVLSHDECPMSNL